MGFKFLPSFTQNGGIGGAQEFLPPVVIQNPSILDKPLSSPAVFLGSPAMLLGLPALFLEPPALLLGSPALLLDSSARVWNQKQARLEKQGYPTCKCSLKSLGFS